jgi:hypothetical protein
MLASIIGVKSIQIDIKPILRIDIKPILRIGIGNTLRLPLNFQKPDVIQQIRFLDNTSIWLAWGQRFQM